MFLPTSPDIFQASADSLHNYDILEQVGHGGTSVVYLATCKRGRMRNRLVALKKILPRDTIAHLTSSTSLHLSLHHPSILSLLGAFSTPTVHYQVLEFCHNGTLSDFLQRGTQSQLSEDELRGVARNILDGLLYLRKELVLHRDIKPSNVLLNEHFRVKICDFGLAIRLSSESSTVSDFCGSPNYVSPEIVARSSYGFNSDIWSFGALLVTCLTGVPAFHAPTIEETFENISRATYILPDSVSYELRDLTSGLLQIDPNHRTPIHRLASHPFFNPTLPVLPLEINCSDVCSTGLQPNQTKISLDNQTAYPRRQKYPASLSRVPDLQVPHIRKPHTNLAMHGARNFLSDEWKPRFLAPSYGRRVSSAPQSRITSKPSFASLRLEDRIIGLDKSSTAGNTPALTFDSGSVISEGTSDDGMSGTEAEKLEHPLLLPPVHRREDFAKYCYPEVPVEPQYEREGAEDSQPLKHGPRIPPPFSCHTQDLQERGPPRSSMQQQTRHDEEEHPTLDSARSVSPPISTVPIGPTRPTPLNTMYLVPQAHKVAKGQITVLPSRSLLVDFREGERRNGRQGTEVLVINDCGVEVKVYSAPHLSTPCCLVEPISTYSLNDLSPTYWKQYNDACHLVDQLKQRIPKLVLYKPEAQCTLMANEPRGDIEVILPPPNLSPRQAKSRRSPAHQTVEPPSMRIKLLRRARTLEIARHVVSRHGSTAGEWTKKVIPVLGTASQIADEDWNLMESTEQAGLNILWSFLRVCEALDKMDSTTSVTSNPTLAVPPPAGCQPSTITTECTARQVQRPYTSSALPPGTNQPTRPSRSSGIDDISAPSDSVSSNALDKRTCSILTAATSNTTVLPSIQLAPRPAKFSNTSLSRTSEESKTFTGGPQPQSAHPTGPPLRSYARYVPSVGWCTRYRNGQSMKYKVLLADGGSLEIDPEMERIKRRPHSGHFRGDSGHSAGTHDTLQILEKVLDAFASDERP